MAPMSMHVKHRVNNSITNSILESGKVEVLTKVPGCEFENRGN